MKVAVHQRQVGGSSKYYSVSTSVAFIRGDKRKLTIQSSPSAIQIDAMTINLVQIRGQVSLRKHRLIRRR